MRGNPHREVFVNEVGSRSLLDCAFLNAAAILSALSQWCTCGRESLNEWVDRPTDETAPPNWFPRPTYKLTWTTGAASFATLEASDCRDFQLLVDIWRDRIAHAETQDA